MRPHMVEMDYDKFLERFMPINGLNLLGQSRSSRWSARIPNMSRAKLTGSVAEVCEELCKVSQAIFDICNTQGKLVAKTTTRNHPDYSDVHDYTERPRVDLCFYPAEGDYDTHTHWAWISLLAEIKTRHEQCAFEFQIKSKAKEVNKQAKPATSSRSKRNKKAKGKASSRPPHQEHTSESSRSTKKAEKAREQPQEVATTTIGQDAQQAQAPEVGASMSFIRSGIGAEGSLGEMADYVSKIFRRQHRTHLFSLFVFQGQARIVRWDRAGAIVSTIIDFAQHPSLLHKVIWRYARMNQVQRGFDSTVVLATKIEIDKMRNCHASDNWIAQRRNDALNQRGWPVYKIKMRQGDIIDQRPLKPIARDVKVDDLESGMKPGALNEVSVLVGKRYFATNSHTGRGTKCYIAYDLSRDRLVFLKDYWRPDVDSATPEGEVLRELRTSEVENVPTPLAAGDVRDGKVPQRTRTQDYLDIDERTQRRFAVLVHYRLVVKEICRPLEDHKTPLILVRAVSDAFEAHRQAWMKKQYIHRDISSGNILLFFYIDLDGRLQVLGVLNDWGLCKAFVYLKKASRPARFGTWQFMSARLLENPGKVHEIADDIEAFVHVLRWMCLRFYEHALTGLYEQLCQHVMAQFEGYDLLSGEVGDVGGTLKKHSMLQNVDVVLLKASDSPLGRLLDELRSICGEHYQATEPKPKPKPVDATGHSGDLLVHNQKWHDRWAEMQAAMPSALASRAATSAPRADTKQPTRKLANHDAVGFALMASYMAVADPNEWKIPVKTHDQFDHPRYKSALMQRSLERSSEDPEQISSDSKRPLRDLAGGPPTKRSRGGTSQLASLEENVAIG